jgi:hypothetical protein
MLDTGHWILANLNSFFRDLTSVKYQASLRAVGQQQYLIKDLHHKVEIQW